MSNLDPESGSASQRARNRASIVDVAQLAGVSVATVSRALRGMSNVSEDTREKVLRAATALNYAASPMASGLVTGRMRTVGVVSPFAGRWFFAEVIRGIEQGLRDRGYDLLLHVLGDPKRRAQFFTDLPVRRRVDALIIVALPLTEHELEQLQQLGIPLIMVSETQPSIVSHNIDDEAAARLAVQYLINLGHRDIAMIAGNEDSPEHFASPGRRSRGYRSTIKDAGLPLREDFVVDGGYTAAGGETAMAELLSRPIRPTAVFCHSDEMAFGAMRALRGAGLSCPQDVSLIGIDDHELSAIFDVTTVAQPLQEEGLQAATWIVERLENTGSDDGDDSESEHAARVRLRREAADGGRVHPVKLIQRGSTAAPRS